MLKVGLYFHIEPKISGLHNSPSGEEGSPFGVGLLLSRCRHMPKMNEIPKPFGRNQHTLPKFGSGCNLGPHNSPIRRAIGLKFGRPVSFVQAYACDEFDRDCSMLAYTFPWNQKFRSRAHDSPSGGRRGPAFGRGCCCPGQAPAKNELNRFSRLARDHPLVSRTHAHTYVFAIALSDRWASPNGRPMTLAQNWK